MDFIINNNNKYSAYIKSTVWRVKRKEALKHYQSRCRHCGSQNKLEVHHIGYDNFGNEKMEDLMVLCKECHVVLHKDLELLKSSFLLGRYSILQHGKNQIRIKKY